LLLGEQFIFLDEPLQLEMGHLGAIAGHLAVLLGDLEDSVFN